MRNNNEKGYSLIEVLIGLLIFTVGALASGALIIASLHQNQRSREKSVASTLVSQQLEELRSRPWSDSTGVSPDLAAGGGLLSDDALRSTSVPALTAGYFATWNSELTGARDSTLDTYYLLMWQVEDMTDSGLDFKRVTIKGAAIHWHRGGQRWEPVASIDHVAMIFREIKE